MESEIAFTPYILAYKRMQMSSIFRELMKQSKVADASRELQEEQLAVKMYLMQSSAQAILDEIPSDDVQSWLPAQMNTRQSTDRGQLKDFQGANEEKSWEHHLIDEIYNNHWSEEMSEADQSQQGESAFENLGYKTEEQLDLMENRPNQGSSERIADQQGSSKFSSTKQSPVQSVQDCIQMPNRLKRFQSDSILQSDVTLPDIIKTRKFRKMQ